MLLPVAFHELGPLARELLGRQAAEGHEAPAFEVSCAGRVDEHLLAAAVGHHEHRLDAGAGHVLRELPALALRRAAEIHEIRPGRLHARHQRLEFLRLRVDRVVAEYLDADLAAALVEEIGDAFAIHLAVIEDVHLLDAALLGPVGRERPLEIVGGHHAGVVEPAGGPVDLRLAGRAEARLREADGRIRRRHHEQVAEVQNRHRDLGGAGVERADVGHDVGILEGPPSVGRLGLTRPLARGGRRVVEVEVFDAERPHLAARLLDRHPDAAHDRVGLLLRGARPRQARHDRHDARIRRPTADEKSRHSDASRHASSARHA